MTCTHTDTKRQDEKIKLKIQFSASEFSLNSGKQNISTTGSRQKQETSQCDLDGGWASLIRLALSLGDMSAGGWWPEGGRGLFYSSSSSSSFSRAVRSPPPVVTPPLPLRRCHGVDAMVTASAEQRAVATGAGAAAALLSVCLLYFVNEHTFSHQLKYTKTILFNIILKHS